MNGADLQQDGANGAPAPQPTAPDDGLEKTGAAPAAGSPQQGASFSSFSRSRPAPKVVLRMEVATKLQVRCRARFIVESPLPTKNLAGGFDKHATHLS